MGFNSGFKGLMEVALWDCNSEVMSGWVAREMSNEKVMPVKWLENVLGLMRKGFW